MSIHFRGAMHPRHAIRIGRTERRGARARRGALWRDALTAIVLGAAAGAVLVITLSGGLHP